MVLTSMQAVYRLSTTWERLSEKDMRVYTEMRKVLSLLLGAVTFLPSFLVVQWLIPFLLSVFCRRCFDEKG
jgi:hypothetical protein